MQNIQNFEMVASLPPSVYPWKIHAFDHGVIIANPEHPPRIIRKNGTIDILKIPDGVIKTHQPCKPESSMA